MARRQTNTASIQLPSVAEFLKSLDTSAEYCTGLLGVKGPVGKILPANIRTQMRTLTRINDYWAKNRSAYNALLEASQTTPPTTKAQRAGA